MDSEQTTQWTEKQTAGGNFSEWECDSETS